MSKYSLSFKLSIIEFYDNGARSYREVGERFGVDHSTVRKWIDIHALHGQAGLEKKFRHYSAAFKLSVLRRMWEDGLSRRQVAAMFNIRNAGCLSDWEKRYESGGLAALASRRKGRPRAVPKSGKPPGSKSPVDDKAKSREELLAELKQLRMENAFLKKLEALTREQAPIKRKSSRR